MIRNSKNELVLWWSCTHTYRFISTLDCTLTAISQWAVLSGTDLLTHQLGPNWSHAGHFRTSELEETHGSASISPPGTATARSHVSKDKRFKTRLSEVAGCSDECQDKTRVQLCCSFEELTMRSPAQIKTGPAVLILIWLVKGVSLEQVHVGELVRLQRFYVPCYIIFPNIMLLLL